MPQPSLRNTNSRVKQIRRSRQLRIVETLEPRLLLAADFGDAPAPYPTLAAENGAEHTTDGNSLQLGATRNSEVDGSHSADASSDTSDDGVTFVSILAGQQNSQVTVNASSVGKVDAWIDFNGDGSWGGPGEQILDGADVIAGDNDLSFDVPSDAQSGPTIARVRLSTAGDLGIGGTAPDGEVEDSQVTVTAADSGAGLFASQAIISTQEAADSAMLIADLNGDGLNDVVSGDTGIFWNSNLGNGVFGSLQQIAAPNVATGIRALAGSDLDGDGDIDIVSGAIGNTNDLLWHENDGAGSFTSHTIAAGIGWASGVAVADVDLDGDIDILTAATQTDTIAWYENDGDENFSERQISTIADGAAAVAAVDLDNDGDIDVVGASENGDAITLYTNNGSQNFTALDIITTPSPRRLEARDIDGDGDLDLVSASLQGGNVLWHQNNGAQPFTTNVITDTQPARAIASADIDGDGDYDVVAGLNVNSQISLFTNDGAGVFSEVVITAAAASVEQVGIGDLDDDGVLDIASVSVSDNKLAWYANGYAGDPPTAVNDVYTVNGNEVLLTVANPLSLVDFGDTWNYLDTGVSGDGLGTFDPLDDTWFAAPGFDDSGWRTGPSEIGYGDGDEATVIRHGPEEDNALNPLDMKYIAYYFRSLPFDVADPASIDQLGMSIVADDGAAVYINGVEAFRRNLAADAVFDTLATQAGGDGKPAIVQQLDLTALGITLLETGNIVAVEVHQTLQTSSDISLDLSLGTASAVGVLENDSDNEGDEFTVLDIVTPPTMGDVVMNPDGSFAYTPAAGARRSDSFVYRVEEVANPGQTSTATVSITIVDAPDAPIAVTEHYVVDPLATLNASTVAVADLGPTDATRIIAFGEDNWRYLDDGSDQGATGWRESTFDLENPDADAQTDDAWKTGQGELGYGDNDEVTVVLFGPNPDNAQNDGGNKFVTTYFRKDFQTPVGMVPADIDYLLLNLKADDGAIVTLNGQEIARQLLHGDNIHFLQHTFDDSRGDGTYPRNFYVEPLLLNPAGGDDNIITVEIHQVQLASSDISMDMELLVPNNPVGVRANDFDPDFNALQTVTLITGPTRDDSFALNADGTFTYDPNDNFNGEDSFTYAVNDGTGLTSQVTVTIQVGDFSGTPPIVVSVEQNVQQLDPPDRVEKGPQPTNWDLQRSEVLDITITFDQPVVATANDLILTNLGVNATLGLVTEIPLDASHVSIVDDTVILTFAKDEVTDGVYELQILSGIANEFGLQLDGNADGEAGDSLVHVGNVDNRFQRFTADFNGDTGASVFDFSTFAYWFGLPVAADGAPSYVDLNADGGASVFDFAIFSANFGIGVTYPIGFAAVVTPAAVQQPIADTDELQEAGTIDEVPQTQLVRVAKTDNPEFRSTETSADEDEMLDLLALDVASIWN
jgi:hypothetical protein